MASSLDTIWVKRFKGGPMDPVVEAQLDAGLGLAGNSDRGGKRQVTLLEAEVWEAVMVELSARRPPSTRRANLLLRDLALPRGKRCSPAPPSGPVTRSGGSDLGGGAATAWPAPAAPRDTAPAPRRGR
jgi:hypothetical protein